MTGPFAPIKPVQEESGLGVVNSASMMEFLFWRADANLTRTDLVKLASDGAEYAASMAGNSAFVLEAIGCMVGTEGRSESPQRTGIFLSQEDLPTLLFHFSEVLRAVEGSAHVAAYAASALEFRGRK